MVDGTQAKYPYDHPILRRAKMSMLVYAKAISWVVFGSSGMLTGVASARVIEYR